MVGRVSLLNAREVQLDTLVDVSQADVLEDVATGRTAPYTPKAETQSEVHNVPPVPTLRVVRLRSIEEALRTQSELEVLNRLADSDDLIDMVDPLQVRCALISYRQERGSSSSSQSTGTGDVYDHLTLDGDVLQSIVAVARDNLSVDAVWLDAWCYRSTSEAYDHYDFCRSLHSVLAGVCAIVWLPRTKLGSRGEYPYRLWCTFEAACVQQRGLRVAVAGAGTSSFQRYLQRFGSYAPALWADGTLDALVRLNLSAYLAVGSVLLQLLVRGLLRGWAEQLLTSITGLAFLPLLWLCGRGALAQQVRLAKNARMVLRIMEHAAAAGHCGDVAPPTLGCAHVKLLRELPWLRAYDRRDALVVMELLARSRPDLRPSEEAVVALAISTHTAARLQPSGGDISAHRLALREWLQERHIDIDRLASGLLSRKHSQRDGEAEHTLISLKELSQFGWTVAPGASCALLTPLGGLAVSIPKTSRWSLADSSPLPRARALTLMGGLLAATTFQNVGGALVAIGRHQSPPISLDAYRGLSTLFSSVPLAVSAYVLVQVWRADAACMMDRRVPLPFVVFARPITNVAVLVVCALSSGFNVYYGTSVMGPRLASRWAQGTGWGAAYDIVSVMQALGVYGVGFLYEIVATTVFLYWAGCRRGWAQGALLAC